MSNKKIEVYNAIEIGGISIVSKTSSLKEMVKVANKLLKEHKDIISFKREEEKIYYMG